MAIEAGLNLEPGRLPTTEQQLMLKAVLLEGREAGDAARTWLEHADIDSMGMASLQLLPRLYDRLRREGIDHPLMPRLKGLKKYAWYNNQLLFHRAAGAIRILNQAGIEVMVIKGIALTIAYYHDYGLRPMQDADLLVRHSQARAACEALRAQGWRNEDEHADDPRCARRALSYHHAAHLTDPSGRDLDLHWNLLAFSFGPDADADFWTASRETTLDAQKVRILDPADQLLHICVHGTSWNVLSPIRWIPDAIAVIRATPELDWERLLAQARKRRLTVMVGQALDYIERNFGGLAPSHVLSEFRQSRVTAFEKFEYRQLLKPTNSFPSAVNRLLCKFVRVSAGKSLPTAAWSVPGFFCAQWNVARKRELPLAFCRKAARKVGELLDRRSM